MATVQSLFERYGIKTPQQIQEERRAQQQAQIKSGNAVQSIAASTTQDIENLMRGFGWASQAEKDAAKSTGMLSAIQAIPKENMTPELEQYYTSQLAAIDPNMADQYQRDLLGAREAMLKASREQFGTTKVTVPEYKVDSKGNQYQSGTRSIDVPAKFDPEKGWVPVDAKYANGGAGNAEDLAVKFESNWYNNTNNQLADWKKGTPSTSTVGGGLGNVDLMSKNAGTGSVDPMTGRTVAGTSELSGLDAAVQKEMVGAYANYVAQANASGQMPIGMEEWLKANYK